jgi:hypothetical protein
MKAVMAPMVKIPAAFAITAPLSLRPPVLEGLGVLVVAVKLERTELAELTTEEREEREEESPDLLDEDTGVPVVVEVEVEVVVVVEEEEEEEGGSDELTKVRVEVGGLVSVMEGRGGIEVGLFTQTSLVPGLTVIGELALPSPPESLSTITTTVPAGIVTISQVNESPVIPVNAARTVPSAVLAWKA